jgi:hypothetical protein
MPDSLGVETMRTEAAREIADSGLAEARATLAARSEAAAEPESKHEVGILFVHGIGEQPEGDTLLAFGEPVIRWLDRWLRRGSTEQSPYGASIEHTMLTPSKRDRHVPPHARIRVVSRDNDARPASWLMAESWWGGDVQPPPFGKLAGWMMTVGAWSILSHVSKHVPATKNRVLRALRQVLAVVVWLVLSLALQIIVVILSVLALLPIPGARKALSGVLLALTGVLGDSYVLLESDLQRSAIVGKTRDALGWLLARSERVIVVAHSQGADIAHLALRSAEPSGVHTLFTFGSGLGKLEELLRLKDRSGPIHRVARLSPVLLILFALLARITLHDQWDDLAQIAVYAVGFSMFLAAAFVLHDAAEYRASVEQWISELSFASTRPAMTWIDVHASHDPVCNGPLSSLGTAVATEDQTVVNLGSLIRDHTAYWNNRIEFVPRVLDAIARTAKLELFSADDRRDLAAASRDHRRAVRWLAITQWTTVLSALLLPVLYWRALRDPGGVLDATLRAIGGLGEKVLNAFQTLITWLDLPTVLGSPTEVRLSMLGALLFAVAILIWRIGFRVIWRWWDERALERLFHPGFLAHWADRAVVDVFCLALGFAPLLVVLFYPFFKDVLIGHVISAAVLLMYSLLFLAFVVRLALKTYVSWPALRALDRAALREIREAWVALFLMIVVMGFILPAFFPQFKPIREVLLGLIIAAVYIGFLAKLHMKVLSRLQEVTQNRYAQLGVLATPPAVTVVAALWLVYVSVTSELPWDATVLLELPVWYALSAGGIYLVLSIALRYKLRRAAT